MSRPDWQTYFLDLAEFVSKRATCPRLSVGCVIVHEPTHVVLATGYNGADPGEDHCIDVGCLIEENHCVRTRHAEINALDQFLEWHSVSWEERVITDTDLPTPMREMTAYVTHTPCLPCRYKLEDWGITNFKWAKEYPNGIDQSTAEVAR